MKVLVTGATGFAGGHLNPEMFGAGHDVVGTALPGAEGRVLDDRVRWMPLDLTDHESVRRAIDESEIHLAAQSSVGASFHDPSGTWDVNASGTVRLLDGLRRRAHPCSFLLVSSAEVYGAVAVEHQPIREGARIAPRSMYAASKAAAEMAVFQAASEGFAEVRIARSFDHTGPGQSTSFALPDFAHQIRAAPAGILARLEVGDLSVRRDFLDVRDVVRAYRILLERGKPGKIYNVCSGEAPTLRSLVERLIAASGRDVDIVTWEERIRPVDIPVLRGDSSRLRALGWAPEIENERTIRDLYRSTPDERTA